MSYLFQYTGFIPKGLFGETRKTQAHVAVVLPTKKTLIEALGWGGANFVRNYVSAQKLARSECEFGNKGAQLAIAKPGTFFYQDCVNHTPGENVWVEGPAGA